MIVATVAGVRGATLATLRTIDPVLWMLTVASTIGTNLLDFWALPPPGNRPGPAFVVAAAVRVGLVCWISYALLRRIAGTPAALRITRALWPYSALLLALLVAFALFHRLALAGVTPATPLQRQWLALFLLTAGWSALTIPLLAWQAHLANGGAIGALGALLEGSAARTIPLFLAFAAIVLPLAGVHLALTLLGIRLPFPPVTLAALAVVDGSVQALQLAFGCGLCVVAWRLALREPPRSR